MTVRELARRVKTSAPSISRFLNGTQRSSRLAPAIAKETGVPLPTTRVLDDEHARWIEYGASLRDQSPETSRDLLEALEGADVRPIDETMRRVRIAFAKMKFPRR